MYTRSLSRGLLLTSQEWRFTFGRRPLWPLPGQEHVLGGAGDAFFWFFVIVAILVVATIANVGALVCAVQKRKRRDGLTNAIVWAVVAASWLCARSTAKSARFVAAL